MLTERREYELAEEGFIGLTYRKDSDNACFFSANSAQRPKTFGLSAEGQRRRDELPARHPAPLHVRHVPHLRTTSRCCSASRSVRGRSAPISSGSSTTGSSQYVADMDVVPARRARPPPAPQGADRGRPTCEGNAGWYKVDMKVRPHFKYMGAYFTLTLVGKLDKE